MKVGRGRAALDDYFHAVLVFEVYLTARLAIMYECASSPAEEGDPWTLAATAGAGAHGVYS